MCEYCHSLFSSASYFLDALAHNGMDCEMKTYTDAEYIKSEFISTGSDDEKEGCYALLLYVWSKVQS